MLDEVIKMLLVGTRYLVWGMGVVGIPLSIVLLFANIKGGLASVAIMFALVLLSIAVTLLLMPGGFVDKLPETLQSQRMVIGGILIFVAMAIAGLTYFRNNGFPELNLIFMKV